MTIFEGPLQKLIEEFITFLPHLIVALIVFGLSLLLAGVIARWVRERAHRRIDDLETLQLLSRLTRWSVIVIGTLVALDQVNFDITGFLAGLGVAGLTVGFALQDIARNFVAGILLLVRQPFNIGDAVEVAGYEGSVLEITTRDTVIKTWDGEMVILANTDVFNNPIVNYGALPTRRRTIFIGLGYGEDVDRASGLFLKTIQETGGVLAEPPAELLAEELGNSALILAARFWVNQETHNIFKVHSDVVKRINETAEREGIDLPYPIQTLRLEQPAAKVPTAP